METNGKNQLDRDTLQLVLEEFTVEQKTTNQNIGELIIAIDNLGKKLDVFKDHQLAKNDVPISMDTAPVKSALEKGFLDIKYMIGREPKSITRKLQILLFPEQDAKLFYKIVFEDGFIGDCHICDKVYIQLGTRLHPNTERSRNAAFRE
jgi:hypothetical protein